MYKNMGDIDKSYFPLIYETPQRQKLFFDADNEKKRKHNFLFPVFKGTEVRNLVLDSKTWMILSKGSFSQEVNWFLILSFEDMYTYIAWHV